MAPFVWQELNKSPSLNVKPSGSSATRTGLIAFADIVNVVEYLFPPTLLMGGTNTVGAGAPHPDFPWLFADEINFEPWSDKPLNGPSTDFDSSPTYQFFQCTIKYVSPKWSTKPQDDDGDPIPFLNHNWTTGGEFLTIPNTGLRWKTSQNPSDKVTEELNAGILLPTFEHSVTWMRVVSPPFAAMRNCIGRVNNAAFVLTTGTIYKETFLFLGAELSREVMSDGARAWNVTYKFSEKAVRSSNALDAPDFIGGWNHFWRPEEGGFYPLTTKEVDPGPPIAFYPVFRLADFSALFPH